MDALTVTREVAETLGLDGSDAVVLREVNGAVVHLPRSGVVARVAASSELAVVRREVEVCAYLAAHGAPVAVPYGDPGPHLAGDHVVSLWRFVDHDPARPLDGEASGRALREVHEVLADYPHDGLPHFARLDEVREIVRELEVDGDEADRLAEMVALAEQATARFDVPLQPVHGDAWLGNVLRTPAGPRWSDFEKACLGPRELDLACNETAARQRGRTQDDDDFLRGYGAHDPAVLDAAARLELVPMTAWTYRLAESRPEYREAARDRLAMALEGLRTPPRG